MKAVILKTAGSVENLHFTEISKPTIKKDEVLVKVVSISINPVDIKARANEGVLNWIFEGQSPAILGWDISGEITAIGENVRDFKIGDEVFGMVNFFGKGNAYAEYVAAPESHLSLKPNTISHQEAAASSMVSSTAYQALVDVAKIKKGDKVLIHGASGGVGHAAVQIAKYFGAYVVGTSSAKNRDFVLSLGADEHIDYASENFSEKIQDFDIVLDTIQGETLDKSVDVLREGGIIVTLPTPEIPLDVKINAEKKKVNIEFLMVSSKKETITHVAKLLESKALVIHIHKAFSFADISEAHLELETKKITGKIVVNI